MSKIPIHFVNDKEVHAIWDDGAGKRFFSVPNAVGVLSGQDDYATQISRQTTYIFGRDEDVFK